MPDPCNDLAVQIAKFLVRHAGHGEVVVALDVVPNVIRFDCQDFDCPETLQIRYEDT